MLCLFFSRACHLLVPLQMAVILYLYLPNWHTYVVRYDHHSSSLRLWYPELASIREKYLMLVSFGNISWRVHPLWTGHMSNWLCLVGSKQNLAFHSTKLLHHSAVSSMPSGVMSSCCCHSSYSLTDSVIHKQHVLEGPGMVCCLVSWVM